MYEITYMGYRIKTKKYANPANILHNTNAAKEYIDDLIKNNLEIKIAHIFFDSFITIEKI